MSDSALEPDWDPNERLNCFALVTYIPGPLGAFLDQLRAELEPNSTAPRAHVTALPPRPLTPGASIEQAERELEMSIPECAAFEIGMGNVEVFPVTHVVYLSIETGWVSLQEMHRLAGVGALGFQEQFSYHPHVTLAQGLTPEESILVAARARIKWENYSGPRHYCADRFTFVQNTVSNCWRDLVSYDLRALAAVRTR